MTRSVVPNKLHRNPNPRNSPLMRYVLLVLVYALAWLWFHRSGRRDRTESMFHDPRDDQAFRRTRGFDP